METLVRMDRQISVFLLAGNRLLREALVRIFNKRDGFFLAGAASYDSQSIKNIQSSQCTVLLLDSIATRLSNFQFIRDVLEDVPGLRVVLIDMEEDEETFFRTVRSGAVGYVLKDASTMDVINAVRAVDQDEAVCPPRLSLSLFKHFAREWSGVPNIHVKLNLGLTLRQQQLVPLIARGLSNKEIAEQLKLSEQTVKNHVHRMMQRVGVSDRLSVVELIRLQGVLV